MSEYELIRKAHNWIINQLKDPRTFEERKLIDFDTPANNGSDLYSGASDHKEETKYINVLTEVSDTLRFVICLLINEVPRFLPSHKFEGMESYLQFAKYADWSKDRERFEPLYDLVGLSIESPMSAVEFYNLINEAESVRPDHRQLFEAELRKCLKELAEDTHRYYLEPITNLGSCTFDPVSIEKGDLICVNIVTGTLWIEKKKNHPKDSSLPPSPVPETPTQGNSGGRRYYPVQPLVGDTRDLHNRAHHIACVVAWTAGFGIGDDTELYLPSRTTRVFRTV